MRADRLMGLSGQDSPLCLDHTRDLGHQPTAQEELARRSTYPAGALLSWAEWDFGRQPMSMHLPCMCQGILLDSRAAQGGAGCDLHSRAMAEAGTGLGTAVSSAAVLLP